MIQGYEIWNITPKINFNGVQPHKWNFSCGGLCFFYYLVQNVVKNQFLHKLSKIGNPQRVNPYFCIPNEIVWSSI